VHYRDLGFNKEGILTNDYIPQSNQEKYLFLHTLSFLGRLIGYKCWILGGDFNIILTMEEKSGGTKRLEQDSGKFRELIDKHNLIDIETINGTFTWSNRIYNPHQIACRLECFLIS